jgi:hypothetical protein
MRLGPVVVGAIAVFVFVLVSLVLPGRRQARARRAGRSDLGLQRVAIPDPVLAAGILSAFPANDGELSLAVLERVTTNQPGAWFVAMVKHTPQAGQPALPQRVVLVIEGLPRPGDAAPPTVIDGTNGQWTGRWAAGLLLVEGVPEAGDAVRDFDAMKAAGARAVAAASTQ